MKLIILCVIGLFFDCNCLCPPFGDTKTISLEDLRGAWWVTASTPAQSNSVTGKCVRANVDTNSTNFVMVFKEINQINNKSLDWLINVQQLKNTSLIGSWQKIGSKNILKNINHQIIENNYNGTLMMILCIPQNHLVPQREIAMTFSRTKHLDETTFEYFKNKTISYEIQSPSKVDNTCE